MRFLIFQYGITPNIYSGITGQQIFNGFNNTTVNANLIGLSPNTTYYYRLVAENSMGSVSGDEVSFTTLEVKDAQSPVGTIRINNNSNYTNLTAVTLSLSATDNIGVTGYFLSFNNVTPSVSDNGWVMVNSSAFYSANLSYTLAAGDGLQEIYCWYKDAADGISAASADTIFVDTASPEIIITSPTSEPTYVTRNKSLSKIGGTAKDSGSGIYAMSWSSNKGESGIITPATNWSVSDIALSGGENIVTVTVTDSAGNNASDTLSVNRITSNRLKLYER